jgi:hypothetical protein
MSIITQTIDGQDFYVRSPLTTVTCNSVDYNVHCTMPLTDYTVGGEVDSATATEHFELIETTRVNEAIVMSYALPATDADGNVLWSLTDNCPYLTAV